MTEDRFHLLEEITGADGGVGLSRDEGDLYADPHKVMEMLRGRSFAQLTSLTRSADYKSEVGWRLGFRQFPWIDLIWNKSSSIETIFICFFYYKELN